MSDELIARVAAARDEALERVGRAANAGELRDVEVATMGRKAPLSEIKTQLGRLGAEERPLVGRAVQEAIADIERAIARARDTLEAAEEAATLEADRIDVTLPGRGLPPGHPHPITVMLDRIVDVFISMGYRVAEGPEVETDWYNFEALNMPPDHPARSLWDTLYIAGAPTLLRTHTSPVQIRELAKRGAPIKIIAPGRVYRNDEIDATHQAVFHQVEALVVDRGISMADLKGTVETFFAALFGADTRVRIIPTFFPFVEPGADVHVSCIFCKGAGCRTCKGSGWIELAGAGEVHPKVLEGCGVDPEEYSGFAFGLGLDRVAMMLYEYPDLRLLFEGDERFLSQFARVS